MTDKAITIVFSCGWFGGLIAAQFPLSVYGILGVVAVAAIATNLAWRAESKLTKKTIGADGE